jgi:CheY-like chemotaxis protein
MLHRYNALQRRTAPGRRAAARDGKSRPSGTLPHADHYSTTGAKDAERGMGQASDAGGGQDGVRQDPATILVVEDEALIRMVIADHLRDAGFAVLEARSADEALRMLDEAQSIHIVFSDINLPGSNNGIDLAQWLRANRPAVPVVLTSGVGARDMPAELRGAVPMIMKPYDLDVVLRRLKTLLAGRP